jgi:sugar phosphate isomerase/epimerase
MSLRLAVATEDFGQPLRRAIELAAENAVQGLRLNARSEIRPEEFSETALRQLRLYVEEHQMTVAGLSYPSRHSLYDEKSLDQRLDGIRSAMRMVRKLGTCEVLVRVGRIPDPDAAETATDSSGSSSGPSNDDVDSLRNPFSFAPAAGLIKSSGPSESRQFEMLCDIINDLVAFGSREGATLQLQLANYDAKRIARLLDRIKAGPVALVFDPAICVMTGSRPVKLFRDLYQSFGYMRARDAQKDVDGGGIETPLGDGSVDWMELLPTLVEANYPGWICIERTGGDQRADDVCRAVSTLRKLLPLST